MATTADLLARVRDLLGEETADLYDDAAELLPLLNDGKNGIFADIDVLPKFLSADLVAGTSAYSVADAGRIEWIEYESGGTYTCMTALRPEEVRDVLTLTGTTPSWYTVGIDASGVPNVTVYPPVPATYDASGSLYGLYYAVPADLDASGSNPTWHKKWHFLPCYHAAAVALRKDRRPEAATEMEARYRAGIREYERWFNANFPYKPEHLHSKASALSSDQRFAYPHEIG